MNVLVVEDNPAEAKLTEEAFAGMNGEHSMIHLETGERAMDFLLHQNGFADATSPDLVLLDLNLPGMNGREVLREIKLNERLRPIPVVVISNSNAPEDINSVYRLNGNCYLIKPGDVDEFFDMIRKTVYFWELMAK